MTAADLHPHPVATIFPLMGDADLRRLADDIAAHGQIEPVMLHGALILDGRNRLAACALAGTTPDFVQWSRPEAEIVAWIVGRNLHRRHLSSSQRAMVASRLATLGTGQRSIGDLAGIPTQDEAAEMMNVSVRNVRRAREVIIGGRPDITAQVDCGRITINAATLAIRGAGVRPSLQEENRRLRARIAELEEELAMYRAAEVSPSRLHSTMGIRSLEVIR